MQALAIMHLRCSTSKFSFGGGNPSSGNSFLEKNFAVIFPQPIYQSSIRTLGEINWQLIFKNLDLKRHTCMLIYHTREAKF